MKKMQKLSKNDIFAAFVASGDEDVPYEGVHLAQVATEYEIEAYDLIDDTVRPGDELKDFGFLGLTGIIAASIRLGYSKKEQIIRMMRAAAPSLSPVFCGHLLDLLTGTNGTRHAVSVNVEGDYRIIEM